MSRFTMQQVIDYGRARNWKPLGKRAWKEFRQFAGIEPAAAPAGDIATSQTFARIYSYLAAAEDGERSELAGMDPAEAWAELKRRAKQVEEIRRADQQAEAEERSRVLAETIERLRHVRCWRLTGLYMEDRSMARYTYAELEQWRDWAAGYSKFRGGNFDIRVEAEGPHETLAATVDWTDYFVDYADPQAARRFTDETFDALCRDLAAFTQERRESAAQNN